LSEAPTVSVVLVSHNGADDAARCVLSLLDHTLAARLEIILVDNASSEDVAASVIAVCPSARVILNAENVGFARACNQGMAGATGDLYLLLNTDTYVVDDVIGRAAARLLAEEHVGMLTCDLRYPDGRRQTMANRRLSVRRSLVERLWLYRLGPAAWGSEYLLGTYWDKDRDIEVDWIPGAFMLLKPDLYEKSGGFDPRFFMYGEDGEWCMRLRRMGERILYAPSVGVVYHLGAASSDRVWTDEERLVRCQQGGLDAYATVYGRLRGHVFQAAELLGTAVRWAVYSAAWRLRSSEYLTSQAQTYGWLMRFYARARIRSQ
jgi:GT2 family glycosyltransferase